MAFSLLGSDVSGDKTGLVTNNYEHSDVVRRWWTKRRPR
jgi:hypothetical protein